MKERPILFSAPMVRAILAGTKTQTRRIVKPQPDNPEVFGISPIWGRGVPLPHIDQQQRYCIHAATNFKGRRSDKWIPCPFGAPGDRLWVRETFAIETNANLDNYSPPHRDGRPLKWTKDSDDCDAWEQPHYRATDPEPVLAYEDREEPGVRWKPAIHMPRWASRITLEVTGVRVERLQDISEKDAEAEGLGAEKGAVGQTVRPGSRDWFRSVWDDIHDIHGPHGWDANPWVWAISFKRVDVKREAA